MATEAIAWPAEPSLTDANDADSAYNMGIKFAVTNPVNCVGVRWRVPDSVAAPAGTNHAVSLWVTAGEVRVALKIFTPTPGVYQDILFDTPVALTATPAEYVAAVYTNHYVYRAAAGSVSTPSGNLVADQGRLTGGPNYPTGVQSSWYYVSPILEVAAGATAVPNGIAAAVALGAPVVTRPGAAPAGVAVTGTVGTPAVSLNRAAGPVGLAVAVSLGVPAVAVNRAAGPAGVAAAVALGVLSAGRNGASPTGVPTAVGAGSPTVSLARSATPAGVGVAVALGVPSSVEASRVTLRPSAGTTARPFAGITPRP